MSLAATEGVAAPLLAPGAVRGGATAPPAGSPSTWRTGADAPLTSPGAWAALEREGLYRREDRPFWPHLTLARVRKSTRRAPALPSHEAPGGAFPAPSVTLYRSILRPEGALYEALARRELGG